jgi:ferredoxin
MKLAIDWTRCDGHGLCAALLPTAVTVDEWGYPIIDQSRLPDENSVRRAVGACPALALRLDVSDRPLASRR